MGEKIRKKFSQSVKKVKINAPRFYWTISMCGSDFVLRVSSGLPKFHCDGFQSNILRWRFDFQKIYLTKSLQVYMQDVRKAHSLTTLPFKLFNSIFSLFLKNLWLPKITNVIFLFFSFLFNFSYYFLLFKFFFNNNLINNDLISSFLIF